MKIVSSWRRRKNSAAAPKAGHTFEDTPHPHLTEKEKKVWGKRSQSDGDYHFLSSPFSLPPQTVHKRQSSIRHLTSITITRRMGTTKSSYDGEDSKSTETLCQRRSPGSQRFFTHLSTSWVHFNFVWISTPRSSKLFRMRYHELRLDSSLSSFRGCRDRATLANEFSLIC